MAARSVGCGSRLAGGRPEYYAELYCGCRCLGNEGTRWESNPVLATELLIPNTRLRVNYSTWSNAQWRGESAVAAVTDGVGSRNS